MSTAAPSKSAEIARLLNQAIEQAPQGVVALGIEKALASSIEKFRDTLPTQLKSEAERFVRRAIIYYQTAEPKTKLHLCTPQSFVMCVLEAAEIGLPLDGKLCHAIAYNNKKQDANGKDYWVYEATCMPDYKGLIAVAKRAGTGTVKDIYAEIVCENDRFSFERTESEDKLSHRYELLDDRGKVVGCYVKVKLPDSSWRFEILPRSDIDQIRNKSKAATSGPWKDIESSDWREMAKKTAIKRILKGFMDDPGIARAMELDDKATGYALDDSPVDSRPKIDRLAEKLLGTQTVVVDSQLPDDRREYVARPPAHPEMLQETVGSENQEPTDGTATDGHLSFPEAEKEPEAALPGPVASLIQATKTAKTATALESLKLRWRDLKSDTAFDEQIQKAFDMASQRVTPAGEKQK